jgi:hypothetical protein
VTDLGHLEACGLTGEVEDTQRPVEAVTGQIQVCLHASNTGVAYIGSVDVAEHCVMGYVSAMLLEQRAAGCSLGELTEEDEDSWHDA